MRKLLTLDEVLRQALQDDQKIDKYEARVIREIIMADGIVSEEEKRSRERASQQPVRHRGI